MASANTFSSSSFATSSKVCAMMLLLVATATFSFAAPVFPVESLAWYLPSAEVDTLAYRSIFRNALMSAGLEAAVDFKGPVLEPYGSEALKVNFKVLTPFAKAVTTSRSFVNTVCLAEVCSTLTAPATTTASTTVTTTTTTTSTTSSTTTTTTTTTTEPSTTTTATTTRPPTTTVAPPSCGAPRPCNCKPGASEVWGRDFNGCSVCMCVANGGTEPAPTTTRRPAPAPTTTRSGGCGAPRPCNCKPGASEVWDRDFNGCSVCMCVANGGTEPAPTTTRRPAPAPTTTRRPAPAPANCDNRPCNCKPGALPFWGKDSNGCDVCSCRVVRR